MSHCVLHSCPALSQSAPPPSLHSDAAANQSRVWRQSRSKRGSRAWARRAVAGWEIKRSTWARLRACAPRFSHRLHHPPITDRFSEWSSCPWSSTSARPSASRCRLRMRRSWRKARSQTQHPRGSWVTMRRMKGRAERAGAPRRGRSEPRASLVHEHQNLT